MIAMRATTNNCQCWQYNHYVIVFIEFKFVISFIFCNDK
nr:hypothetical protein [Citrobacter freundii]